MVSQTTKPKVALIGEINPGVDAKYVEHLRTLCDLIVVPQGSYEESLPIHRKYCQEQGPFVACLYLGEYSKPMAVPMDKNIMSIWTDAGVKLFSNGGAGYERTDVGFLTSVGAVYANNPEKVGWRTADSTAMMILMALRGISEQERSLRAGKWFDNSVKAIHTRGTTLGIIGMGTIGQEVARHMQYFGMKVIYNNRSRLSAEKEGTCEYVSREELFARSDVISLNCPLTDATKNLIGAKEIAQMKDEVILVNLARGGVVVEDDMLDALDSGKILRIACDVHIGEPNVSERLRNHPKATLTPHCAVFDDTVFEDVQLEMLENLEAFLLTGKAKTPVN